MSVFQATVSRLSACDSPFLPTDLIERLHKRIDETGAEVAVAKTGDQPHQYFRSCAAACSITRRLPEKWRPQDRSWYATLNVVEVSFDDEPEAFANINTREELHTLENAPPA